MLFRTLNIRPRWKHIINTLWPALNKTKKKEETNAEHMYSFKEDMLLRKYLKCPEYMQRTQWQTYGVWGYQHSTSQSTHFGLWLTEITNYIFWKWCLKISTEKPKYKSPRHPSTPLKSKWLTNIFQIIAIRGLFMGVWFGKLMNPIGFG